MSADARIIRELEAQIQTTVAALESTGIDLKYGRQIPGMPNWRLQKKGDDEPGVLAFGDTLTPYSVKEFASPEGATEWSLRYAIERLAAMAPASTPR